MIPSGLSTEEAARRLARFGLNELERAKGKSPWRQLASQFKSLTILLLLIAGGISFALREIPDGVAILAIVVINALVGFFQEYRAEKALLALRSLAAPKARVQRDRKLQTIPARDIVPGDVLFLEAGDLVAADARLLEANLFETREAALTGESLPVAKGVEPVPEGTPLAEQKNRIFLGTTAVAGTAWAEVTATGMKTELGRIAGLLSEAREEETPLQVQVAAVGRTLLCLCLAIVAVVAGIGFFRGLPFNEVLLSSVSLAVASVPEGLPAVVTIALAIGVQRMAARSVLVRKLPAVETLGCATVICTDKTGTL
ncbi:MAG: HAD-IC family P-type ATPase, partial [Bdellovibrionota bacterium]